jgi:hypothetical protein
MVCDLSGQQLQKIYDSIKVHYGNEAAKNFVVMVADVPVMSATDFLLALYRLESAVLAENAMLIGATIKGEVQMEFERKEK